MYETFSFVTSFFPHNFVGLIYLTWAILYIWVNLIIFFGAMIATVRTLIVNPQPMYNSL